MGIEPRCFSSHLKMWRTQKRFVKLTITNNKMHLKNSTQTKTIL